MVNKVLFGQDRLPTELDTLKHTRDDNSTSDSDVPTIRTKKRKKSTKKRRSTYDIRKQQKSDLVSEVTDLQKQLDGIKQRILIYQGEATKSIESTETSNDVMKEYIHDQHVTIARLQAMMATHSQQNMRALHPSQTIIRLGEDKAERQQTLLALKDRKLREAEQFITARCQGLDPTSSFSQEDRHESLGDEFSVVRFDNAPFRGATVKEVFDAMIYSVQNAEIIISEMFGSITIREDTDFSDTDLSQFRLVTSTAHGAIVESNSVFFTKIVEAADGDYALVVADFVDDDTLYPYRPDERVRRDSVTIVLIRSVVEPGKDDKRKVVVGTRWSFSKHVHTELDIPKEGLNELYESSVVWGDTMKKCMLQRLSQAYR
ncbi:hypothetical protein PHYBOEH_011292 [Phytophthora boehmeriae]|uniref:Uncharacterized protein n=1 Tax=Phytophthora boehmeriae TaxID=109152 RepID=A0A8T1VKZ2_9STRA|nr:hypothetical protein PHYBOEH_011292 [Phytophthora boehmeriae]